MTTRDKWGVAILIALFIILAVTLYVSIGPVGPSHAPEDSIFVRQRMINLQKGNQ